MLTDENRLLKEEITSLKAQDKSIMNKLLDLESRSRRNKYLKG